MENFEELEIIAWVGEDEFGSGRIGIKQARVPAGMIPLAAVGKDFPKLSQEYIQEALQQQANAYGKTIRLCRFRFVAELIRLTPNENNISH